jgi:hypothetical protein
MQCKPISLDNYLSQNPPIKDRLGNGTELKMKIRVFSISNFDEMDMTFKARFSIHLEWNDWRVTFYNLKLSRENYDHIGTSDQQKLWLPRLIFSNSYSEAFIKFDDLSSVIIKRKGKPALNSVSEIHEEEVFDGDSNSFHYNRTYELEFNCNFELQKYPFDRQICHIDVSNWLRSLLLLLLLLLYQMKYLFIVQN